MVLLLGLPGSGVQAYSELLYRRLLNSEATIPPDGSDSSAKWTHDLLDYTAEDFNLSALVNGIKAMKATMCLVTVVLSPTRMTSVSALLSAFEDGQADEWIVRFIVTMVPVGATAELHLDGPPSSNDDK